jgi:hypothetical protein
MKQTLVSRLQKTLLEAIGRRRRQGIFSPPAATTYNLFIGRLFLSSELRLIQTATRTDFRLTDLA